MKSITIMIKPVSGLCNMKCRYCFYEDEMKHRTSGCLSIMSEATLEQILKKAADCSVLECTIAFQGGEPTLAGLPFYETCAVLVQSYLPGVRVHYAIQTNGYALNEAWCALFQKHGFLVGVSLDGVRATHDSCRTTLAGDGTYVQIMKNLDLLKQQEVPFNILTVVHAKTAPKIRRIYESYKKSGFTYQQYIAFLDPLDGQPGDPMYSLTPLAYGTFLCDLFDLWYTDLQKGTQPYIRQFESYVSLLLGQDPGACEQRGICGCQNVIESDGSVYPCDFYVTDEYCIGNVWEDSFHLMDPSPVKSAFLQQSQTSDSHCRSCPYVRLCRNGCRRLRVFEHGEYGRNRYCEAYRMFFEHAYERLVDIGRRL